MKVEQMKKVAEEAQALQARFVEQSFRFMDDANVLMKAQLKYWTDLQAEAQKQALSFLG